MLSYRDFLEAQVERLALETGTYVYQVADCVDSGCWIFKGDDGLTTAMFQYNYKSDSVAVRDWNNLRGPGVICRYGDNRNEQRLFDFMKSKLPKEVSLDDRLVAASKRSFEGSRSQGVGPRDYIGK